MRRVLLRNYQSPGDIVTLTAAVRDLHLSHPGEFITDVRTACDALWENNPYLTRLGDEDPEVERVDCEYPLIHESNDHPVHFIRGFTGDLEQQLGVPIEPTAFKGDIHISDLEKGSMSQVQATTGHPMPFWIIVAGGKTDYTIKWWDSRRWQQVVDHFVGRIMFVQVGEAHHFHPPLERVHDLRGKTDLRQLVRLVYHAQGVLCPVTLLMHLAAAVEVKGGCPKNRPCVVVAGGREPMQWEAYPHHQYIHTNGALLCCDQGGCWKSRTVPLGDGDAKDEDLCVDVVHSCENEIEPALPLPRCMNLITAEEVIRRIQLYFDGGAAQFLTPKEARWAERAVRGQENPRGAGCTASWQPVTDNSVAFVTVTDAAFFPGTVATVNSVRRFHPKAHICVVNNDGCETGLTQAQKSVFTEHGISVIDARKLFKPGRKLGAWELKAYAAADLTENADMLVGIDSDCLLCGPIDDVLASARASGRFHGGHDDSTDYDESYRVYGIASPARNESYMSASLYVCALTEQNREILEKWAALCDRAVFGRNGGDIPGHGDQGVLNAILFAARGGEGVRLLDNRLWSQHWCYWDHKVRLVLGQFFNETAAALQRTMHCGGSEKFWWPEHLRRVRESGCCIVNYAWFLALLWFGPCRIRAEHLDAAHTHLTEALDCYRDEILDLVEQMQLRRS